jgi:hypothetical protein
MAGVQPGSPQPPQAAQQNTPPSTPGPDAPTSAPAARFAPFRWQPKNYSRRTRLLVALAIIFLPTIGLLTAIFVLGFTSNAPGASTPAPPLTSVTVQLLDVACHINQNSSVFSNSDYFYTLGAFAVPGQNSRAPVRIETMVTEPFPMQRGQSIAYTANPPRLFASTLPAGETIKGGLLAYTNNNNDEGLNIDNFSIWSQQVADEMDKQLQDMQITSGNLADVAPDTILQLAARGWLQVTGTANMRATELGRQPLTIATQGAPNESYTWNMSAPNTSQTQGWNYTVHYQVTRSLLAPTAPRQQTYEQPESEQEALTSAAPAIILVSAAGDVAHIRHIFYLMTPE